MQLWNIQGNNSSAGLGGFEPPTSGLEARRSIQAKPQAQFVLNYLSTTPYVTIALTIVRYGPKRYLDTQKSEKKLSRLYCMVWTGLHNVHLYRVEHTFMNGRLYRCIAAIFYLHPCGHPLAFFKDISLCIFHRPFHADGNGEGFGYDTRVSRPQGPRC